MKRVAEDYLKAWLVKKDRQPLIIRGARQVGKSTLVKLFCQSQNLKLLEINLEKIKLISTDTDHFKIQELIDEIQLKTRLKIDKQTLIFFDEIQESPKLLKAIRYFYEERPDLAVICAGSLLEIVLAKEEFSFPVGRVEFYNLGPMTFTEFLWATGNDLLVAKLNDLDFSVHVTSSAKEMLNKFYYVGGMPKAVKVYSEENSLTSVRETQQQIIQTYLADFPKYNSRINSERVDRVFYSSIRHLGEKVIWQKLDPSAKARETRRIIELLINARVLIACNHSESNSIPLKGEEDHTIFKLYFLDIGLANALLDLSLEAIDYEMKNNFNTKGIIAEQFVAQHLAYKNPRFLPQLHYWLRDKGSQKGEIDFVIENQSHIIPIEVKAAKAGHLKSLFYFSKEKSKRYAVKISLDHFSSQEEKHIINGDNVRLQLYQIPQYAIEQIDKILKT